MIVSSQYRFLFIHINRTGGTSIEQALRPFANQPRRTAWTRFLTRWRLLRDPQHAFYPPHLTARMAKRWLPDPLFDAYFSAAFIRNPYSWLVALYNAIQTSEGHRYQKRIARMSGFPEYIDWEIRRHKRSQSAFVTDRQGRLMVDFIGRFETLQDDFQKLCAEIGLTPPPLPHAATRRPHADYRTYYDDATREKVARHWRFDIESFGYDFDGLVDPQRLPPRRRQHRSALSFVPGLP